MDDSMSRYKVTINTDAYKCRACSKKNWEHGTMNDYMLALNGWHTTEYSIKQVMWRIGMFAGYGYLSEWNKEKTDYSKSYKKWRNKKCNQITYLDRLCGFTRRQEIRGYGFTQGYFNVDDTIKKLKQNGVIRIPFEWLYDARQYYKGMDGCYMEIIKVG